MSEEMTRKEVIDWLYRLKSHVPTFMPKIWHEKFIKALQFAIASLETDEAYNLMYEQPEFCADALSRKELLKKWEETTPRGRTEFDQVIMTISSVLPKAKKGHWIKEDRGRVEYSAVCSECGDSTFWSEKSNFCPNCGAKLESEDNK